MTRTRSFFRRTALTAVLAGSVALGSVALAPAASADDDDDRSSYSIDHDDEDDDDEDDDDDDKVSKDVDGSSYVVAGKGKGGPAHFLVTDRGRKPIFFCDADKPKKRQNNCQADPEAAPDRF